MPYTHQHPIHQEQWDEQGGEEIMTIFIHGAMHVLFAVLSPPSVLSGTLPGNSWYERAHARVRLTQEAAPHSLRKIPLGLTEYTSALSLSQEDAIEYQGTIYHVLKATATAMPALPVKIRRRWFAFGWSGLLNEAERIAAGKQLYDALITLKQSAEQRGVKVRFELYAFSHGGQLALQLPSIRKAEDRTDFQIDTLILAAAPLFRQNTRTIWMRTSDKTTMFKTIWNLYSPGDFAQTVDKFSTPEHICFQTIAETLPTPQHMTGTEIREVALYIDTAFSIPHEAFFDMGIITIKPRRIRRSQEYQKRYSRAQRFTEHIAPFPITILYPAIIDAGERLLSGERPEPHRHLTIHMSGDTNMIRIEANGTQSTRSETACVSLDGIIQARSSLTEQLKPLHYENITIVRLVTTELTAALATLFP